MPEREMPFEDPASLAEQYINDHIEPESDINSGDRSKAQLGVRPERKFLGIKLGEQGPISYREQGEVKVSYGQLAVRFNYEPFNKEQLKGHNSFQFFLYLNTESREKEPFKNWRYLSELELSSLSQSEQVLKVSKLIPPDYLIIYQVELSRETHSTASADVEAKVCIVKGDLVRPAAIIGLLHEIGHAVDYERQAEAMSPSAFGRGYGNLKRTEAPMSAEMMAHVLKLERNAWAFVLRKLRPFMNEANSPFSKEIIRTYIHDWAIKSYSDQIRKKIEAGLVELTSED